MNRKQTVANLRSYPRRERIITALDLPGSTAAVNLARTLGPEGRFVKVGLELFSSAGPDLIRGLKGIGKEIFLDLKFHDIPNTVARAAEQAARLGVRMLTVHAAAGRRALSAAADALAAADHSGNGTRPALLAVTVLTSLSAEDLQEIAPSPEDLPARILRLARLALDAGCDGLVCSAADLPRLRAGIGPEPLVVTPGIRPASANPDDQRRVTTASEAVAAGADFLVVGRPITQAASPSQALAALSHELDTPAGDNRADPRP